jgi:peptidoglycan/LPS O-acetylase OafA/YrhL
MGFGQEKIHNIQALRGIAVLMVLLYHIGKYEERLYPSFALLPDLTLAGRAGVDLFFVISGFVMVTITSGRTESGGATTFLLRRAARIYPLYWFYSFVYLPIFLFYPAMMNRLEGTDGISLTTSFLLLPSPSVPLVGQGWTLVHEMYFYLVFAVALLRPQSERLVILSAWALIVVTFSCLPLDVSDGSATLGLVLNPMTLEFLAGCAIAWLVKLDVNHQALPAMVLGAALFVVSLFLSVEWHRVLLYLLPAGLLVYGATAVEVRHQYRFPRWLRFLGDISYSVYLSHILVLSLFKKLFSMIDVQLGLVTNVLFIGLAGIGAVVAGAVSYYWVEKPLLAHSYTFVHRFSLWQVPKTQSA